MDKAIVILSVRVCSLPDRCVARKERFRVKLSQRFPTLSSDHMYLCACPLMANGNGKAVDHRCDVGLVVQCIICSSKSRKSIALQRISPRLLFFCHLVFFGNTTG